MKITMYNLNKDTLSTFPALNGTIIKELRIKKDGNKHILPTSLAFRRISYRELKTVKRVYRINWLLYF